MKKLRDYVINLILFGLCFLLSIVACMHFIDNILLYISSPGSNILYMIARILLAIIFFVFIKSLLNKEIKKNYIDFIAILYFLFILSMTFLKGSIYSTGEINLNPLTILGDFKNASNSMYLFIGNLLAYFPLGAYIKNRFSSTSTKKTVIFYIIFIFLTEAIQHIANLGVFDINDIIINFIGFYCGIKIYILLEKLGRKYKQV